MFIAFIEVAKNPAILAFSYVKRLWVNFVGPPQSVNIMFFWAMLLQKFKDAVPV